MTRRINDAPVVHGSVRDDELASLGLARSEVLDLSSNLHPDGPTPELIAAFGGADVSHYPEPGAEPLRSVVADHHALDRSQVLVTAGATAAIHLAIRELLLPGDLCALFPPTFGEYQAATRLAGATVAADASRPPAFELSAPAGAADLGVLCNPNNPTGRYLSRAEVEMLLSRLRGPLLLDVVYDAFVDAPWDADALVREGARVLVVHSLTKLHAIPGLRIGYLTGSPDLIARLEAAQPSWAVGTPEIAAGVEAIGQDAARRSALAGLPEARSQLRGVFERAGVACAPSSANFILVQVGDAARFRGCLLEASGIVVRDATSFGLPDWIRIAVPPRSELPRVVAALDAALAEDRP